MCRNGLPFLRPCLNPFFRPLVASRHARAYLALQRSFASTVATPPFSTHDYQKRLSKLDQWRDSINDFHPRLQQRPGITRLTPAEFHDKFGNVQEAVKDVTVEVFGRVSSVRMAGSKLVFLDLERAGGSVQVLCNARIIQQTAADKTYFAAFKNIVRKGDWYGVVGHPIVTPKGTVSIEAIETPKSLAPSLHQIPEHVENEELLARRPHVKSMISADAREMIILRDRIKGALIRYLRKHAFVEVDTPIIEVSAGGANAKPFETESTELSQAKLKLRVAPELSLKRLIVGGQDKVFEVGKVFRNEGIDATHNPEFTICEFYEVGATLEDLMRRTRDIFCDVARGLAELEAARPALRKTCEEIASGEWQRLQFIPTIEAGIGRKLPMLTSENALQELQDIFHSLSLPLPSAASVPRLLEALEEHYIQPLCTTPTFVTNHPECLSPLAKSFVDPETGQKVAARAELHIAGREYVNCYEEENSPWEQRRKFIEQVNLRHGEATGDDSAASDAEKSAQIDESYLEALEWGMPPTGGWGCGVDRLAMLLAGKERIADVLPFGNLRNIVAIAANGRGRR